MKKRAYLGIVFFGTLLLINKLFAIVPNATNRTFSSFLVFFVVLFAIKWTNLNKEKRVALDNSNCNSC